jgi:hypothetical protein
MPPPHLTSKGYTIDPCPSGLIVSELVWSDQLPAKAPAGTAVGIGAVE